MSGVLKKNICPPLCWLPLVTPLIFIPPYYTPWLSLSHIFEPFGYHSYISFPLLRPFYIFLNPLATTLTSLFPYYTPFTFFLNPLATTLTSLFPYYTPFTYCWTQVQRAGTIRSSLDKSHICLSQTSHWEIWWQRCSFNLQACRKTKQARSTCVVASLLGMHGTENLVWANDLLKGDQDTANMIWSMSHQKISMKKHKIQRPQLSDLAQIPDHLN